MSNLWNRFKGRFRNNSVSDLEEIDIVISSSDFDDLSAEESTSGLSNTSVPEVMIDQPVPAPHPKLVTSQLERRWVGLVRSLDVPETMKREVERLQDRLYISNNVISLYIGDIEQAQELVRLYQPHIESKLRDIFGEEIQFKMELELTIELAPPPPDINGDDVIIEEIPTPAQINEKLSKKAELEAKLAEDQWDGFTRSELIRVCGELGRLITERRKRHSEAENDLPDAGLFYQEAIEHSRFLYQIPKWRESSQEDLLDSLNPMLIVEFVLTSSGLFRVLDVTKRRMQLQYLGSELRKQLGNRVFVDFGDFKDVVQRRQSSRSGKKSKYRPYFVFLDKLSRDDTKFAWEIVRYFQEIGSKPIVFLEKNVMVKLLLERHHLEVAINQLLDRWIISKKPFRETRVVKGLDFYGRQADIELCRDLVESGQNFHIVGLRRSGKTSLLYFLKEYEFSSYPFAIVDAREIEPSDCIELSARLMDNLFFDAKRKHPGEPWTNLSLHIQTSNDYSLEKFREDILSLAQFLPKVKIIIAVDEIEIVVPDDKGGGFNDWWGFLNTVKRLHQDEPDLNGRFVFATVARLPVVAIDRIGPNGWSNPLFGDKVRYLPKMSSEDCRMMLEDLGLPLGFDFTRGDTFDCIVQQTGCHAFTARELCDQIVKDNANEEKPLVVTPEMVNKAIQHLLGSSKVLEEIIRNLNDLEHEILEYLVEYDHPISPNHLVSNVLNLERATREEWKTVREDRKKLEETVKNLCALGLLARTEDEDQQLYIAIGVLRYILRPWIWPGTSS